MLVPLDISYRDVKKTESIDSLIREKVQKLERICDRIISCHVALEMTQSNIKKGNPYRLRIDLRIPKSKELVVKHEPGEGDMSDSLPVVIRDTFETARRRLQDLVDKQKRKTKNHVVSDFLV